MEDFLPNPDFFITPHLKERTSARSLPMCNPIWYFMLTFSLYGICLSPFPLFPLQVLGPCAQPHRQGAGRMRRSFTSGKPQRNLDSFLGPCTLSFLSRAFEHRKNPYKRI